MCPSATVSIIIVNWNSGEWLAACLDALGVQTVRPDRIVVVDNASSDASWAVAEAAPGTTLMRQRRNLGFAEANNIALEVCETDYIALLNPDALPAPDWLECLLRAAADHPEAAAFGSRQISFEDAGLLDGIGDAYHLSGRVWRQRHRVRQSPGDLLAREIFSPCAAAALYRRQAVRDTGGFDGDFFCYVEDVDLGFRLRLAGHTARYVPEAVVRHVGSATTGGQHSDFSVYYGHRNLVWTFVKDMPGVLFWGLLPLHLALNLASVFWFLAQGRPGLILRAKRDALKGLPRMWGKRRQIQARRKVSVLAIWRVLDRRLWPAQPY